MGARGSYALYGIDACHVGGHEVREIELEATAVGAGFEQLGYLRSAQLPGQTDDATVHSLHDADPTIHSGLRKGKTNAKRIP